MSRVNPKVQSATAAAAAASLVVGYALHLPDPVSQALIVLATFLGGWFKKSASHG
jgi:hypothetical protein